MKDLKNWKEISKGFYRYVVGANVCYEIHIIKRNLDQNIYNSKAKLYLVGDWHDTTRGINYFERKLILDNETLENCIKFAIEDYEKNMQ